MSLLVREELKIGSNAQSKEKQGLTISYGGEELELRPERAIYWRKRSTLLIADPHFGKAATFRLSGLPIPDQTMEDDLARLTEVIESTKPTRLLILGYLLHAKQGREEGTISRVSAWRESHRDLEIVLVRGNHDRSAGDPPKEWNIHCVTGPLEEGPFTLLHEPKKLDSGFALAGHLHPSIFLTEAKYRLRVRCFAFNKTCGVLPAFGSFTGNYTIDRKEYRRIYAVGDAEVVSI
jgi:uncharacterized protein